MRWLGTRRNAGQPGASPPLLISQPMGHGKLCGNHNTVLRQKGYLPVAKRKRSPVFGRGFHEMDWGRGPTSGRRFARPENTCRKPFCRDARGPETSVRENFGALRRPQFQRIFRRSAFARCREFEDFRRPVGASSHGKINVFQTPRTAAVSPRFSWTRSPRKHSR
jgi:hypothetical protein